VIGDTNTTPLFGCQTISRNSGGQHRSGAKTRLEKEGAKFTIKGTSSTGSVSIEDLSERESHQLKLTVISFSTIKMDKVELS
jgi:hypothetical protein